MLSATESIDLDQIFNELNQKYFEGLLVKPELRWNTRLRSAAGRFIPGRRLKLPFMNQKITLSPTVEIAFYLLSLKEAEYHIKDTMAHELVHYWLWAQKKPYGHTAAFKKKLNEIGASRYNLVPSLRRYKYIYSCPQCSKEFYAKRKWRASACLSCCKENNGGIFHLDYKLYIKEIIVHDAK